MINGVIVSVFVPLACSLLSLAFHCYGNYRQRKAGYSDCIALTSIGVDVVALIACLVGGVYALLNNATSISLANMLAIWFIINSDLPTGATFHLRKYIGVDVYTAAGRYSSIKRAMSAAARIIDREPESSLTITDENGKKVVVINPPNSLSRY